MFEPGDAPSTQFALIKMNLSRRLTLLLAVFGCVVTFALKASVRTTPAARTQSPSSAPTEKHEDAYRANNLGGDARAAQAQGQKSRERLILSRGRNLSFDCEMRSGMC
jgi:hypothetical protein